MITISSKIKRFFGPILHESGYFWRQVAIKVLFAGYAIVNVFFIKEMLHIIEIGEVAKLPRYIAWYAAFGITYFALNVVMRDWGWAESTFHLKKMIHREYMWRFNEIDNTYIERIGTGRIISIIGKWSDTWASLVLDSIKSIIQFAVSIIGALVILSQAWWVAVSIFLVLFIVVHIGVHAFNKRALEWRKKRVDVMNEYDRQLVKMVMSKFEILQNDRSGREISVLDRQTDEAKYYNLRLNNYLVAMFVMPNIVYFILVLIVLITTLRVPISFAELASIFMIIGILKTAMEDSIDFFKNFTQHSYAVQKMWQVFDDAPRITGLAEWNGFVFHGGSIEVKNLSFSYKDVPVFSDFSLRIEWGKKTAFVGLSGSGKSTLVKLVAGYLHPTSGSVTVDEQDLSQVKLRDYYGHIGYLTQEPSVFDGTILENLTYGARSDVSDADLRRAIELAQCEFIYEFPNGLDTEIGEKWVRLSGGQRQRLAIAKIFIKDPEIIILDEPTSALDSFSEEKISEAFQALFKGRTVLIIAHRLQTVKEADDIIVLEHGNVVERWDHESLVRQDGVYAKMLKLQSGF